MKLLLILAAAAALIWLFLRSRRRPPGMTFELDDQRMAAAKQAARDTLDQFWAALDAAAPGDSEFGLKFDLNRGSGLPDRELIWALDIVRSDGHITGTLANPPINRAFKAGDRVKIDPDAIVDWCFFRNGVAQGHHITRLMIEMSSAQDAAAARAQLGW